MMQTDDLVAGPALDVKVATEVMGLKSFSGWEYPSRGTPSRPLLMDGPGGSEIPAYSSDIGAAFLVVEYLKDQYNFEIYYDAGVGRWSAAFSPSKFCRADAAPLAICLAALAVVS